MNDPLVYLFFQLVIEALHKSVSLNTLCLDILLLGAGPLDGRVAGVAAAVVRAATFAGTATITVCEATFLTGRAHLRSLEMG